MTTATANSPSSSGRRWVKARRTTNANACVEVMLDEDGRYHVRDTKTAPAGPVITLSAAEWDTFRAATLRGTDATLATVDVHVRPDGSFTVTHRATGVVLDYTPLERECFLDGLRNAEFTPEALAATT